MNVKLLEKVKEAILAEPRQFVMGEYFVIDEGLFDLGREIPNCGTAACIAGWAVTLGRRFKNPARARRIPAVGEEAVKLLRLDEDGAFRLFLVGDWPWQYREAWSEAKTAKARAKVAAKRIDHFIATDGDE